MKYVRIKNNGEIEPEALSLVGASTKRTDTSKIGQFGSGNKFALAYLLRNGYNVQIFAGHNEIKLTQQPCKYRDQEFQLLYVNSEKTSITLEMGKDWQFWQAMREIYCNAIDEGGNELEFVNHITPIEGETHFYIENQKDVMDFIANFDNYFAERKKVLFECRYGRILEKSGEKANIYRKGIRCYNSDKLSVFDYDFNDIEITEDRIVKYSWEIAGKIWNLVYACEDKEVILSILHQSAKAQYIESSTSYGGLDISKSSQCFKDVVKSIRTAPRSYAGALSPEEQHNHIIVPTEVFESIRGVIGNDNVGTRFKVSLSGELYTEVVPSELTKETLNKALDFLKEVQFDMPYDIKIVKFGESNIMGCAHQGEILISELAIERGVNDTVNTIIEEFIHLKHGVQDETRAFQTASINELIAYMKKVNAFAI